jgi:hypothetical protein
MGVMVTACSRPQYFRRTLDSWAAARNISEVDSFTVALGRSAAKGEQAGLVDEFSQKIGFNAWILEDSPVAAASHGMHRAIAEAVSFVFAGTTAEFVVAGEEDVVVSDDVLEYMEWASRVFEGQPDVLAVCAHDMTGCGWDKPSPGNVDASPRRVRLRHYFNPWVWGTWRDKWSGVLLPQWEYCDPPRWGTGYDWNIATRIVPAGRFVCAVPDASRSQNIGEHGGVYSTPDIFTAQQTLSFREHREPVDYSMAGA